MNASPPPSNKTVTAADWAARALFFVVLTLVMFSFPSLPRNELDPSWRMVLGHAFDQGKQFGVDIVFTYGPLGFLMGKTYSGLHYTSFLVWQGLQALVFSLLVFRQGLKLEGYRRYIYFTFFMCWGATYDDGLHQMVIGLVGFELLRRSDERLRVLPVLFGSLLAVLGLIKFTNLMLGGVFVCCVLGLLAWRRRLRDAAWLALPFVVTFLVGWVLCRQSLLNLPAYLFNSWEISQGYQEAMAIPTPPDALVIGLITAALLLVYLLGFVQSTPDRPQAIATLLGAGAYLLLNWKHGFVRSDGHMIGFFYAVMVPATAFPTLLGDGARGFRRQAILTGTIVACAIAGVSIAIPGLLRGLLSISQERVVTAFTKLCDPQGTRWVYDHALNNERLFNELPLTQHVVGRSTVDVHGFEQGIALLNGLNYHPRPVIQSYSAYRPHLSRLNLEFYASDRAPEYVILKLQTIDQRLVTFDDSEVLSLLVHRYEFVHTEQGIQLWRRKPGPFSLDSIAPRPLRSATLRLGEPFLTEEFKARPLWASVDLRPSLLGRLRAFLYKTPIVTLQLRTTQGTTLDFRMPLPMGRTGFIVNPLVQDLQSYMHFAGGTPERFLQSLTLVVAPKDRPWFQDDYTVNLSELPPSQAGKAFFAQEEKRLFGMFNVVPASYHAQTPLSEATIDDKAVMVFHAPSELIIEVPRGVHVFSGSFGILETAYSNGNTTDGADFTITWVLGGEELVLFERHLDPLLQMGDRGLQRFQVNLPPREGGQLRLRTKPGNKNNYAWDWTAWTALTLR